jgi:hypothetical protein
MKTTIYTDVSLQCKLSNAKLIRATFDSFKGDRVEVIIQKAKRKRSTPQNAYLHGVVIPMITDRIRFLGTRITQAKVKDLLKFELLKEEIPISSNGEFITTIKGTSELTTAEFKEFIDNCVIWAADTLDIQIPEPKEQIKLEI